MFIDGDLTVHVCAFLQHWDQLLQLWDQELMLRILKIKNSSCWNKKYSKSRGKSPVSFEENKSRGKCAKVGV